MAHVDHNLKIQVRMLDVERVELFCSILQQIGAKHPHLGPELVELAALAVNPKTMDDRAIAWWTRMRLLLDYRAWKRKHGR